ncbi:hypothetical protein CFI00_14875 [Nocardioides sp. S5]|nr:hypothetical protein CFI00_14875 [Nocardioides sp. S5]
MPVALFCSMFLVYGLTVQTSSKVSVDVYSSSLAAWRIAQTGEPWLDGFDTGRIEGYGSLPDQTVFIGEAPNGHRVSLRLPGVVAAAVPAYWVARGGSEPDDFSLAPEAVTAALISSGAIVLLFLALRRRIDAPWAIAGAVVVALGTPMWSVAANAMWTHTLTVFGIMGMAWAASRERWWLVGVFGGIALCGRLHVALIVAVLGVGVALARKHPGIAVKVGIPSATFLAAACAWTYWVYGTWLPGVGYNMTTQGIVGGERYPDPPSPLLSQLGLWVSPDKGVLVWTPALLLLLPAVVRNWRDLPDWSRWLALGAIPYMLLQGQLNHYTGGGAHYAYRLGLELLAAVAPAYLLSAHRMKAFARAAVVPLVGLQVAVIGLGAVLEGPAPAVSYGWTDNAFLVGVELAPALGVIALLVAALVTVVGLAWRDFSLRAVPQEADAEDRLVVPGQDVGSGEPG